MSTLVGSFGGGSAPLFIKALRKDAEAGKVDAMLMLGKSIADGEEALKWLAQAHELGKSQAAGLAGIRCLDKGRKDDAVAWFKKGIEKSDPESLYRLGLMTWAGDSVVEDHLEALAYLQRAHEAGHVEAGEAIERLRHEEGEVRPNAAAAMDLLRTIPKLHHPETMLAIGRQLMVGDRVAANPARGMELIQAAAEQDWPDAHFELFRIHSQGAPQYRNPDQAGWHLRRSADQGHPEALQEVGLKILKQRPDQAMAMLRRAAEVGLPDAMYAMGEAAYEGRGLAQNKLEALRWFRAAAKEGHRDAAGRAAKMLRKGDGVMANKAEAEEWEKVAGKSGGFLGLFGLS